MTLLLFPFHCGGAIIPTFKETVLILVLKVICTNDGHVMPWNLMFSEPWLYIGICFGHIVICPSQVQAHAGVG